MKYANVFPFVAVVGQEDMKEAVLLALINPKVGGLLISGNKATAKTTLLRAAMQLTDMSLIELPLSATEDRVFGHIDLEKTLEGGERVFLPGLLAEADQQILYIDEVNLLRRDLLAAVLQVHDTKMNKIEREGLSYTHPTEFILVGSMNPEEGTLSDALLDRFGLFVNAEPLEKKEDRAEVARRVLTYEMDRIGFIKSYAKETSALKEKIKAAQKLVAQIEIPGPMLQLAAAYCEKAFIAGHRGDVILLETAKAVAALAGRTFLIPEDMERAAYFVLPHRMRQPEEPEPPAEEQFQEEPEQEPENQEPESQDDNPQDESDLPEENPPQQDIDENEGEDDDNEEEENTDDFNAPLPPEMWEDINKAFASLQFKLSMAMDRHKRKGSGKRQRTKTNLRQGRYIRAVPAGEKVTDLALDATIRAAAPYQREREKKGLAITLEKDDLRQKVREKRTGTVFLFCVDASGSMGAKKRMGAVKGAIYGLLQDAYQKRDRVGLITFRRDKAELLLPITRSIDLAQKLLRELPTGGKTPLAAGLELSLTVLEQLRYQDAEVRPVFLLVTDGRATADLYGGNPVTEAVEMAKRFNYTGAAKVVIDTETDFISMGIAKKIARAMEANYYHVNSLSEEKVLHIMQEFNQ